MSLDLSTALDLSAQLRRTAVQAVQWQYEAILKGLTQQFELLDEDDRFDVGIISRWGHQGDPTRSIDVIAHDALRNFLTHRWCHPYSPRIVGEEVSEPINPRDTGIALIRSDPLDGTTNSLTLLDNWATVVCIDIPRKRRPGHFRHMAGAIATSAGWVLSWDCKSHYCEDGIRAGSDASVFLQSLPIHFFSAGEEPRRWQLRALTLGSEDRLAAVCAPAKRRHDLDERFGGHLECMWLWAGAGNPLGPALLAGELGGIIEPEPVSLHDSAFLIPFELLGGTTVTLEGKKFSPLDTYESSALSAEEKSMPAFLAYKKLAILKALGIERFSSTN